MATGLVSRLGGCRVGGTLCCQGLRGLPQFLLPEALQRTGLGYVTSTYCGESEHTEIDDSSCTGTILVWVWQAR